MNLRFGSIGLRSLTMGLSLLLISGCQDGALAAGGSPTKGPKAGRSKDNTRAPSAVGKGSFPAMPLVSRDSRVVSPREGAKALIDGKYKEGSWQAGKPTPEKPSWVAFDIGRGPSRLLLAWTSSGSFNYHETTYGGPGAYIIETSADSKDGEDGTWTKVVTVTGNEVRSRAHAFDFRDQRWVRFTVTAPTPTTYEYGVQLDEIDIHDASNGLEDTWFFMGDSITAMSFDRAKSHQPSFSAHIQAKASPYVPVMINGGIGGEKIDDGLRHLDRWLELNPDIKHWAIGYGTNDSAGNNPMSPYFKMQLRALVEKLKAKGKVPVLARIPYAPKGHDTLPDYNKAIDDVTKEFKLLPGPDLYAYFKQHPEQLYDGLHPDAEGKKAINRLWAEAMAPLYAPRASEPQGR